MKAPEKTKNTTFTFEGSESITFVENEDSDTVIRMEDGDLCCEWVNLDEGYSGDYDPDDPEDENLLRFDIYRRPEDLDGEWDIEYEEPDASFCTMMPADTDRTILVAALRYIIAKYKEALKADPHASMKKIGEKLSHVSPDLFEKVPVQFKPHRELAGSYMVIPTMEASTWEDDENDRCIPHDADIPIMYFAVKKDTILAYLHFEDEGSGTLEIEEWLEDEDTDFDATKSLLEYGLLMNGVAFTFCKEREIPLEAVDVSDKDSTLALMDFLSRELREDGYDDASDHLNYLYDFRTQKPEILLNSEDF